MRLPVRAFLLAPFAIVALSGAGPAASATPQDAAANADRASECPDAYFCLYSDDGFEQPLVSIHQDQGLYKLPDWARDSASSYENNANCLTIRDYDWPFTHSDIVYASSLATLWEHPHPEGGTWDNRVDEVEMSCG